MSRGDNHIASLARDCWYVILDRMDQGIQISQTKSTYRRYNPEHLIDAYNEVKNDGTSLRKAAKRFNVPVMTLSDRLKGKIGIDTTHSGPDTLFTRTEEEQIVQHAEYMSKIGYGYTRTQLGHLATEVATHLGKRNKGSTVLSNNWVYGFMHRWTDRLDPQKPRGLSVERAKGMSLEAVNEYYKELKSILLKYEFMDKPHLIYNVDETNISPEHNPPNIIGQRGSRAPAITSSRTTTATLIACGNAMGTILPPYFVFKGKILMPELLNGSLPGTSAVMSESGWSNGNIFMDYLQQHFLKYVQVGRELKQPILLLYDGHGSHVNLNVIEWAKKNNIILFVLPPHTSHLLQPMDVSCFGPFKKIYYAECALWMKLHRSQSISRYDLCEIACKAYTKSMTQSNVMSGFRKTRIYPFCPQVVGETELAPAKSFISSKTETASQNMEAVPGEQDNSSNTEVATDNIVTVGEFLTTQVPEIVTAKKPVKRNCMKPKVGGKAITERDTHSAMKLYEVARAKSSKGKGKIVKKCAKKQTRKSKCINKQNVNKCNAAFSPLPSTSGTTRIPLDQSEDFSELSDDDSEKCCMCNKFSPPQLKDVVNLVIVNWAQCDKCTHWCHLRFCSPITVVRSRGDFLCPHCVG